MSRLYGVPSRPPTMSDTRYFGLHGLVLRILGLGMFHDPRDENFNNFPNLWYTMYGFISLLYMALILLTEILLSYVALIGNDDLQSTFVALVMVGVHGMGLIKILYFIRSNKRIQLIIKMLEVDANKFQLCPMDPDIQKQSIFFTNLITRGFLVVGFFCIIVLGVLGITLDIERTAILKKNNTDFIPRETHFPIFVPWDYNDDLMFYLTFFGSWFGLAWFGTGIMICDALVVSILIHIGGFFNMTKKSLDNLGNDTIESLAKKLSKTKTKRFFHAREQYEMMFDGSKIADFLAKKKSLMIFYTESEFSEEMFNILRHIIQRHQLVIEAAEELQKSYNQGFFCQMLSSFYVTGLVLVQTAQNSSNILSLGMLNNLAFLMAILFQLFIQTYSANEMTLQAAEISEAAFASAWYEVEKNNEKIASLIIFIIQRTQRPIFVTAGPVSPMSNDLFVSIIKNSYQIFTLITSTMSVEK